MQIIERFLKDGGVPLQGVLHLGAEHAQEAEFYARNGAEFVLWAEASYENIPTAVAECAKWPNQRVVHTAIWDKDDEVLDFHIYNHRSSNSLFTKDKMNIWYPQHNIYRTIKVRTSTVDTLLRKENVDVSRINFLGMDVQGAELQAMKGAHGLLSSPALRWICAEVVTEPLYKNATMFDDLTNILSAYGFKVVTTERHDPSVAYPWIKEAIERGELDMIPQFDTLYMRD